MVAKLNEKDKYAAILLSEDGYSCRQIAEKLNRHHSTISNILKRYKETGSVKERHIEVVVHQFQMQEINAISSKS